MPQSRNELLKIMHSNINPWTDEDNNENLITKVQLIYFMEPVFNMAMLALGIFAFGLL